MTRCGWQYWSAVVFHHAGAIKHFCCLEDWRRKPYSIFDFFINYEKTALQIFFYCVRMFFGS